MLAKFPYVPINFLEQAAFSPGIEEVSLGGHLNDLYYGERSILQSSVLTHCICNTRLLSPKKQTDVIEKIFLIHQARQKGKPDGK